MYEAIEQKLTTGEIIVLDGGTGTEIERRGAPMSDESWSAPATLTHPDIVREVHADYIRAGADVVIANTFGSSPFVLDHYGKLDELPRIDDAAVRLARQAREDAADRPVAVAGSFSVMRPVTKGTDRTPAGRWSEHEARPLLTRKAETLASIGVDFIMMEMMRDRDYSLWATEAAVATGLPVWVGISVERRPDGRLAGVSRHDCALADIIAPLLAIGVKACLVMHTSVNNTGAALGIVKQHWTGPLGAYAESGYFAMPNWQFVDIISPPDFVAACRSWIAQGVTVIGGCCGTGPEHIRALARAVRSTA